VLLLFISIIIWALGSFYARPLLETKIKNAFQRSTSGKYDLSFDDLELTYSDGGLSITNLHVRPNRDSISALDSNSVIEISCSKVSVLRVNFWKTFFSKSFAADELVLETPRLSVFTVEKVKADSRKSDEEKVFGQLRLGKIKVNNASASVIDKRNGQLLFETQHLNMFVDGFDITNDLIPLYNHFTIESFDNSMGIFPGQKFRVNTLYLAGGSEYTGLNASGFDISEIDSSLRKALKIPNEISFSLDGISLESESLSNLIEQIIAGKVEQIFVSKLLLKHPIVEIETGKNIQQAEEAGEEFNSVSKKLRLPSIEKLGILDGKFIWKKNGIKKPVLDISNIHLSATGVKPRLVGKVPFIYSTAEISMGEILFTYPKSQYDFSAKRLFYRSVTDSLKIKDFACLANKSIDSFYMDKKWREDRFEFRSDTVEVENSHMTDFVLRNKFTPENIRFKNPVVNVYTDKRLNHEPGVFKPFPLERLRRIDAEYSIPSISFINGKATYSEKVANSPGLGSLTVEHANMLITGVKNPANITDSAHVYFDCSFGGNSYGEIRLDIPLFGKDEIQYGTGIIKNLSFKQLNSITENTVFMGFGGGKLDSCWFNFKGVNGVAEGNSVFYYNGLKVKLYKSVDVPAYKAKVLFNKTFLSLVANFLINKSNPTDKGDSLAGKIEFKRDMQKGPLNFWIKSIMTGLMNTVIDDISELKDLQEEIKSLKSNSQTGLLSKIKSNPGKKFVRKQAREAKKAIKNADGKK
jgi:hypothetical protein